MEIRYSYRDAPTIKQFSQSDAFIRGLMGPFRSGKSSGCVVELVKRGRLQRPSTSGVRQSRMLVVRNTFRELDDTTIKTFLNWFPPSSCGEWVPTRHNYNMRFSSRGDDTEIEIMFRALDRPDHVKNLLSLEVTGAWINEAREVPWAIVEAIQGRVGQYPAKKDGGCTWSGLIMDTNPPDVDSRWYKFFEETKPTRDSNGRLFAELFKQPSGLADDAENVSFLNDGRVYYERLATGKTAEWIKVYIKGTYGFVIDGKPVYTQYSDPLHSPPDAEDFILCDPEEPIYVGVDFGLTPAAVYTQLMPNGAWYILDELCADGLGIDRFSDQMLEYQARKMPKSEFIYIGDPAGMGRVQTDEKTCFQIMHAKNMMIEPGLQEPGLRQEAVRKTLSTLIDGRPQLLLHPRCKKLRRGFMGGYQYRRMMVSGERYSDKPDKNEFSHPHDGLQYVATRLFGAALLTHPDNNRDDDDDFVMNTDRTRNAVTGY